MKTSSETKVLFKFLISSRDSCLSLIETRNLPTQCWKPLFQCFDAGSIYFKQIKIILSASRMIRVSSPNIMAQLDRT